jgi:PilZ domain
MSSEHRDIVFAERRKDIRIIVSIAGHFSVANRRAGGGARAVFSCRAVYVSNRSIGLISPVSVKIGDQIIAKIDHLGKLEGIVTHILARGFMMSIEASDEEREKLDDKIEWLERYKNLDVAEQRADARFPPAKTRTKILFADGTALNCQILDVSATGAAIAAETIPDIGSVLAIGTIVGRVVRHFKGGFGVKFIERQSDDSLNAMVRRD